MVTIDIAPEDGGIHIAGTADELAELAAGIAARASGAELDPIIGELLTDEGVEDLRVVVLPDAGSSEP